MCATRFCIVANSQLGKSFAIEPTPGWNSQGGRKWFWGKVTLPAAHCLVPAAEHPA